MFTSLPFTYLSSWISSPYAAVCASGWSIPEIETGFTAVFSFVFASLLLNTTLYSMFAPFTLLSDLSSGVVSVFASPGIWFGSSPNSPALPPLIVSVRSASSPAILVGSYTALSTIFEFERVNV